MGDWYAHDPMTALEAKEAAQHLAFAPFAFQAARSLRDLGVLAALDAAGASGLHTDEVARQCGISAYGAAVLLDMGLSARIATESGGRYALTRVGHYLLHDAMTRTNFDFSADVCYRGLANLTQSVREGRPAGLAEFGDWPTIYPHLAELPERAHRSWFAFDHHYSDAAYAQALPYLFAQRPGRIVDIGANTGRFALRCLRHDPQVRLTLVDLPQQLAVARAQLAAHAERVDFHPVDVLDPTSALPMDGDVWWMSQFLDCFSSAQVVDILRRVGAAMPTGATLCVLECFPDRQRFESAALSLNATSLYFTALANGNSRFYRCSEFLPLVRAGGFAVQEQVDGIGLGHSLLVLRHHR
ncbi:MAG: hypothetical protein AMXMBFR25_31110 [Lysobacterales bacterium]|nr:L-tyrosine C(3)-methyltransferase [Xanthomonadales bacterium]